MDILPQKYYFFYNHPYLACASQGETGVRYGGVCFFRRKPVVFFHILQKKCIIVANIMKKRFVEIYIGIESEDLKWKI